MPERQAQVEAATPPFPSNDLGPLGSEEWEGWMKWDNIAEETSPRDSDLSPPSLQFPSGSTGSTSPSDFDSFAPINFSPVYSISEPNKPAAPSKKRKSSAINNGQPTTRQPRGQKISHNVIEKRYRSNLNDKIAKLRDSVPDLRTATPTVKKRKPGATARDSDDSDDDGGLKFNKATVLTKATEYIQQLERQNQRLQSELSQLRSRGGAPLDKLRNPPAITTSSSAVPTLAQALNGRKASQKTTQSTSADQTSDSNPVGMIQVPDSLRRFREATTTTEHYGHSFPSSLPPDEAPASIPPEPVRGMIPLAEDFRRMREEGASQVHYAPESNYYGNYVSPRDTVFADADAEGASTRWPRSKAMSRVLVGSLVGLMFMESFAEDETSAEGKGSISKRGLFSLPLELKTESRGFRAQIRRRIIAFWASPAAGRAASILLISGIFLAVCFAVFVYLAPKGSKNVREGPVEVEDSKPSAKVATQKAKLLRKEEGLGIETSPPAASVSTYEPPPAYLLESTAQISYLRMALDRIWSEWLGLEWLKSHHLDEEAFRRGSPAPDDGSVKEWPDIKKFVPQFLRDGS
ncbi:MAG: hypothetical protein MMC23_000206 [Stictis urceolatum]|nr:hypothetical protein [Stictis urceolata]